MPEITVEVEGYEDLLETIDKMIKGMEPSKIEPELKKGAQIIAGEARKRAPVRKAHQGRPKPPGVLKRAIVVKQLERRGSNPAPAIAAIDRKKAPHAWLVTHGTSGVRKVNPPRRVVIGGRPVLITHTGVMPPNRFFAESIRAKQDEVLNRIASATSKNLEEAMK